MNKEEQQRKLEALEKEANELQEQIANHKLDMANGVIPDTPIARATLEADHDRLDRMKVDIDSLKAALNKG